MKLANDYKSAEDEFKQAIKLGGFNSARPRLILSLAILQKMTLEKSTVREFARCLYYLTSGSLMFTWDFASLKMLYKNFAEDFSVFYYKTSENFLKKLTSLFWLQKFIKRLLM